MAEKMESVGDEPDGSVVVLWLHGLYLPVKRV